MTGYSDSIMDWSRNQSNIGQKEMKMGIWRVVMDMEDKNMMLRVM